MTWRQRVAVFVFVVLAALDASASSPAYPTRDVCELVRVSIDARPPGVTRTVLDVRCVDELGRWRWSNA